MRFSLTASVLFWVWAASLPAGAAPLDDGQKQFVDLGRAAVQTDRSFSVGLWVKVSRGNDVQLFVSQKGQNVSAFTLQKRAGDNRFAFTLSAADSVEAPERAAVSDFSPTPGLWYQLTGVYNAAAGQMSLYADGALLASAPAPRAWRALGHTVLGRQSAGEGEAVSGFRAYPRALTEVQVAALYAADQKRFLPNTFPWANPIYYQGSGPGSDIHDPDILNDGGVYYCVATLAPFRNYTDRDPKLPDFGSAPGIALYASRNLKVWKSKGWIVKSSALPDTAPYKHQFWAPELHKFGKRYYVIFGSSNWIDDRYNIGGHMGYYQFVGMADKITGPYTHFTALKGPGVDTSLFQDDDGKTYAVWPGNEIHPIDLSQIDQDKITVGPMVSRAAGPDDYKALGLPVPGTLEGPYLIKRKGTYYCFFATTYPDLYATGIASAKSLHGPWTLDPRTRQFPCGHQTEFIGPDGRWWMAYKHERSDTTPWLSIDPLNFDAEGRVQMTPTSGSQSLKLSK